MKRKKIKPHHLNRNGWAGIVRGRIDCVLHEPYEYDSQSERIYATKRKAMEYYETVIRVIVKEAK